MIQGRNWEFVQRGLTFFSREAQHPLGLKNSLSTVDITDPGSPPPPLLISTTVLFVGE